MEVAKGARLATLRKIAERRSVTAPTRGVSESPIRTHSRGAVIPNDTCAPDALNARNSRKGIRVAFLPFSANGEDTSCLRVTSEFAVYIDTEGSMNPLERRSLGRHILRRETSIRKGRISRDVELVVEVILLETLGSKVAGLSDILKAFSVAAALDSNKEGHQLRY